MKLRQKKSAKGSRYYLQTTVTIDGVRKQKEFPMGTDKKTATAKANRFLATLEETGLDAALEELEGHTPVKKGDSPTLEQMEELYDKFLAQSPKPLRAFTVYSNKMALGRIMKTCGYSTISQIDQSALRKKMLSDKPTDSQLRGFASTITHAKSMFKPACLKFYKSINIKADDPFKGMELTAPGIKPYTPLPRATIEKIKAGLSKIGACEQIIFILAFELGLRRKEIEFCRTSWFTDTGEKIILTIQSTPEFKVKVNEGRVFPIAREIYNRLIALRDSLDPKEDNDFMAYNNSKKNTARIDRKFKSLNKYLRECGATGRPTQSMRAEFGSFIATNDDIFVAQRILGHSSPTVTSKHYANLIDIKTIGELPTEETPEEKAAKLLGISVDDLKKLLDK